MLVVLPRDVVPSVNINGFNCTDLLNGKVLILNRDIIFLEIIPIALSIFLWHKLFYKKKIVLCIDNMAVVSILNSKTSNQQGSWFYLDSFFIGHL